jgi:hypothetical protein
MSRWEADSDDFVPRDARKKPYIIMEKLMFSHKAALSYLPVVVVSLAVGAMVSVWATGGSVFGVLDNDRYKAWLWIASTVLFSMVIMAEQSRHTLFVSILFVALGFVVDRYGLGKVLEWKTYSVYGFTRPLLLLVVAIVVFVFWLFRRVLGRPSGADIS